MSCLTPNKNVFDFNSCWLSPYLLGQRVSPGWDSDSLRENVLINRGLLYGHLPPPPDLVCWMTNTRPRWRVLITRQSLFYKGGTEGRNILKTKIIIFALADGQLSTPAYSTGWNVFTAACVLFEHDQLRGFFLPIASSEWGKFGYLSSLHTPPRWKPRAALPFVYLLYDPRLCGEVSVLFPLLLLWCNQTSQFNNGKKTR